MTSTMVCPNCGQDVLLGPISPGEAVDCPSCGQLLAHASIAPAPRRTARVNPPVSSPSKQPARRSQFRITLAVIAGALMIAAASAGYFLRTPPPAANSAAIAEPPWEQAHRAELLQLKADAEAAVLAGDLKTSYDKYAQLHALAAAHPIQDPFLLGALQSAGVAQERVYTMLLARPSASMDAARQTPAGNDIISTTLPVEEAATNPSAIATPTEPSPASPLPAIPTLPPVTPVPVSMPGHEADQQITIALEKGIAFLLAHFKDGEIIDANPPGSIMHQGLNALCVYAVLHASEGSALRDPRLNIHDQFLQSLIAKMKAHPMQTGGDAPRQPVVYARSLRAAALAVYNRQEDQQALRADVAWFIKAANNGAYSYDDRYAALSNAPDLNEQGGSNPETSAYAGDTLPSVMGGSGGSSGPGGYYGPSPSPFRAPRDQPQLRVDRLMPGNLQPSNPGTLKRWMPGDKPAMGPFRRVGGQDGATPIATPSMGGYQPPPPPPPTDPPPAYDPLQTDTTPPGQPYAPPNRRPIAPWDNSNSQYGLLGVWSGAEAGVEVPAVYWRAVEKHWLSCQQRDGQWSYSSIEQTPTLSMDCAGVASLLITHQWLDPAALGSRTGRPPYSPGLAAGLAWLEAGDHITTLLSPNLHYLGYTAYGIERCGLASGFKYFGDHDWFREVSAMLLKYQLPNGAWGREPEGDDTLIDTAYIVLFLARGQHPVMMNKLRFDPYWDNRPRDLANLAKFASHDLERPMNWQVVNLRRPWFDWMDSPVLYIASHQPPVLNDEDCDKLRAFTAAGGLIFTHADAGSTSFNNWTAELAQKLWPQYKLVDMPSNHDLFKVNYQLKNPLPLKMVTNGSRVLLVHSPGDVSSAWQERTFKGKKETFQLGVNLFLFAAGRGNFRNRLDSPYIPEPPAIPSTTVTVARLKYTGSWDPEPYAWTRFSRYFQWNTTIAVKPQTVELLDLKFGGDYSLAILTGNDAAAFSPEEANALHTYVESGGTLLIDSCGGAGLFNTSITRLITQAFGPAASFSPIPASDPLLNPTMTGCETLPKPLIRPYTADKLGSPDGQNIQSLSVGKGRILYSPLDLTTALLGTNTWAINGYTPAYALALVKNIVLTTASAMPPN